MNYAKPTPAERAALVRMVSASARLIVAIGRDIKNGPTHSDLTHADIDVTSSEFVDAIIEVQESEAEAVRESYR